MHVRAGELIRVKSIFDFDHSNHSIEVRTRIVQTALALTVHEQRIGAYAEEIIMLLERNIFAAKIDGKLICK